VSVWEIDAKAVEVLEAAWHDDVPVGPYVDAVM
jgi:hypothetical protein